MGIATETQVVEFVQQIVFCESLNAVHVGRQVNLHREIVVAGVESDLCADAGHAAHIDHLVGGVAKVGSRRQGSADDFARLDVIVGSGILHFAAENVRSPWRDKEVRLEVFRPDVDVECNGRIHLDRVVIGGEVVVSFHVLVEASREVGIHIVQPDIMLLVDGVEADGKMVIQHVFHGYAAEITEA